MAPWTAAGAVLFTSLIGSGAQPAVALDVRMSIGAVARQEVLLLASEWRPEPISTFGPRAGVEAGLGERWRAGLHGQWTLGDFRVVPPGPGNTLAVNSWGVQITAARVFHVGSSIDAHLGPVLEYGESESEIDAGTTTVPGPQSSHWSGGLRLGSDVTLFSRMKFTVEYIRLVGGAEASQTDPPVGASWNADSSDLTVALTWSLGGSRYEP